MHLLTRLSCFFTALLLTTAALADSGYFDPISEDKQAVLEQIFAETGVPLSKVTLYKAVSDLKKEGKYLKAIVQIRKKVGDEYVWADDKGRETEYQSIVGGLRKKPRVVVDKEERVLSFTFSRIKKPFENTHLLTNFKYIISLSFFGQKYCNNKSINNLPALNKLQFSVFSCIQNTTFPDLNKMPELLYLNVKNSDLSNASISVNNKIKIAYIEPGKGLKNLNQIKNLTQVEDLSIIMRSIKPEQETITDLSWLAQLPQLKKLRLMLYRQPVKDLSFLKSLKHLKSLYIFSHQAEYIPLGELTQLESLKLVDVPATSLPGLEKLQQLKTLDIFAHKISELPGLEKLTQLESIKLQMHRLYKLPSLKNQDKLKSIEINETRISSLDFIKDNSKLKVLDIFQAPLSTMKDIKDLTSLDTLRLARTNIEHIEGLGKLKKLKILDLSGSPIRKIQGLNGLQALEILYLDRITINKVENLENLPNLKKLFKPNYKHTKDNYNYLKALEARGVRII